MTQNIEKFRKEKKLTQDEVAKYLGITRQTFSKLEKGKIEPTLGQAIKLTELLGVEIDNFLSSDVNSTKTKKFDWEKYKQIVQFFIENWTSKWYKITKTKLAKLCYLADFAWYYNNLESLTNLEYRRIQQGPVPDLFFTMIEELEANEDISVEREWRAHLIKNLSNPKWNKLSLEEKSLLTKIANKWKNSDNKKIVDFTHNQLPWSVTDDKEIIPYVLITQEDPQNVY